MVPMCVRLMGWTRFRTDVNRNSTLSRTVSNSKLIFQILLWNFHRKILTKNFHQKNDKNFDQIIFGISVENFVIRYHLYDKVIFDKKISKSFSLQNITFLINFDRFFGVVLDKIFWLKTRSVVICFRRNLTFSAHVFDEIICIFHTLSNSDRWFLNDCNSNRIIWCHGLLDPNCKKLLKSKIFNFLLGSNCITMWHSPTSNSKSTWT